MILRAALLVICQLVGLFWLVPASEKKSAADAGIDYAGPSPTLKSLNETIKAEYVNALHDVDNQRDQSPVNLFARYIQLLTP